MKKGIGGHQSHIMKTDEWLTPPAIIKSLGIFDLDPCSPIVRPWDTANNHYNINDNGLLLPWIGRIWLNPPYGKAMINWLHKMSEHDNGIALTFARTETQAFQNFVFPSAMSILFIKGRLTFFTVEGKPAAANGGAPSVLIAYGENNVDALAESGIDGKHVLINAMPVITITQSPDWRSVVSISLIKLNGKGSLKDIYSMVERVAPDKVKKNQNYQAKIRQKLQKYFLRVERGNYTLFDQVEAA
jgi:hypothetical protein